MTQDHRAIAVLLLAFAAGVILMFAFVAIFAEKAHGQQPRWVTIDQFGGVNTSLSPQHIPLNQARKVVGWVLREGELQRLTLGRMASDAGIMSGVHFVGQSRSDTSVLVLMDNLQRLRVRADTFTAVILDSPNMERDTAIAAGTFEYDSTFTPYLWDDLLIYSQDYVSEPDVRTSGWLWWAPTTRDYIRWGPKLVPVRQFISNKWLIADSAAEADYNVDSNDTLVSGFNWHINATAGTGSVEFWSDNNLGSGDDTTLIMDGKYLWHYNDGHILDQVEEYFTFVEYPAQGMIDSFTVGNDSLYAWIDTTGTWTFWDYNDAADSTRENNLGGGTTQSVAADSMLEMFVLWDDTTIYARAVPCSVMAAEFVGDDLRLTLCAPSYYLDTGATDADTIHLPDDCFFIGLRMHETTPSGWVSQGAWYGSTIADTSRTGTVLEQQIDIEYATDDSLLIAVYGPGDSVRSRLPYKWPEVYEEKEYASAGEVWRIREVQLTPKDSGLTVSDSAISYNANPYRGITVYGADSVYDALSDGSPNTYVYQKTQENDSLLCRVSFDTLEEAQFLLDSVRLAVRGTILLTHWMIGDPRFQSFLIVGGAKRNITMAWSERRGWADHVTYSNPITNWTNDSLTANPIFGLRMIDNLSPDRVFDVWLETFYTDTSGIDTAFCYVDSVVPYYYPDEAYADTEYAAVTLKAFWPASRTDIDFSESVDSDSTFVIERTKRISDWEYIVEDSGAGNFLPRRGIVHRRRAWYCGDTTKKMDIRWSELNQYETISGNEETLEGNDPMVGLSSFGQELIGYRRRSIFGITGFSEADFYLQPKPAVIGAASHDVIARSPLHNADYFCNDHGLSMFDGGSARVIGPSFADVFQDSINWNREYLMRGKIFENRYYLAAPFGDDSVNTRLMAFDLSSVDNPALTFIGGPRISSMWLYVGAEGEEVLYFGCADSGVVWKVDGDDDVSTSADYRSGWLTADEHLRVLRYEIKLEADDNDDVIVDFYTDFSETAAWSDTLYLADGVTYERHSLPISVQGDAISYGLRTSDATVKVQSFGIEYVTMGDRRR